MYSLSSETNHDLQSVEMQQLSQYECVDSDIFINNTNNTFYICDTFDYNAYLYVIDLSDPYHHTTYVNAYFVNSDPIQLQQLMHNNVKHSTQCDIQSLLVNNTESNVITSLICDFDLTSMPTTQPTVPTPSPVTNYPTASPTTLNKYTCAVTKQFIPNWYHYNLCYSVFMDLSTRDANVDFTETLFYSTYQPQDERYDFYIKYTAVNGNCLDATLSITRRYRREFSLYSAQEPWEELSRCLDDPYPRGASCTSYFECLSDYPLGDIFNGEEYTVHLLGRSRSNSCSYAYDHRDYIAANLTIHCAQVTQPTLQPTMKPSVAPTATVPMMWTEFDNYTCSDLSSPMQVLYNISLSQCKLHCVSVYPSITCTAIVWYEYIKPTGTDTPRCYLFNRSCALVSETTKPVTVAFPYYDEQSDMECVDYPILWEDRFHDNCDAYSQYNWCNATGLLTAMDACCDCNGGLVSYNQRYLLEAVWKPKLQSITTHNFIKTLKTLPTSVPTSLNMDDSDIMDEYIAFWDAFGTHVMRSGKLGGVIKGAITVDKCAAQQSYSDTTAYKTCLNAQYKGVEVEGCHQESDSSVNSNSAA
eukprot:1115838_1